ncbi:MarR family winged helix-turn-helix transcriptional regulator [Paracholeplasma manati]|uniref:MarR family transcriptional regulator n=1 Tax=Paracholeplasma manati TaxID=591373 RepID=A0ABT2Y4F4_9MOLU|nr:MarR family transcriptional regulator [Paracholeplasma manati]MCV2231601.1 MarR family transcriptional regulator [Paracholeplasma manati]MDG0888655.1 MarR family transcriptional regulator [Paracholeplasma manati]
MSRAKDVINELLVEVFNHILSIEGQTLRERGVKLSMSEVHVLEAIKNSPTKTMGDVAKRLRITLGTLTTSIDVLVRKKYVTRNRAKDDKRKVLLQLTDSALETLHIHDGFHDEMIESVMADLELEKDEALVKSLENISNYFKSKY